MDGPVIQQASQAALDAGATPLSILDAVPRARRRRPARRDDATTTPSTTTATSASRTAAASRPASPRASCPTCRWRSPARGTRAADAEGIETVMLAAPTAPDERLPRIAARARGFVYSVGLLGVTGERDVAGGVGHGARRPAEGDHGCAGARRCRRVERRAGLRGEPGRRRRDPGRVGRAPDDGGGCRTPSASTSPRSAPRSTPERGTGAHDGLPFGEVVPRAVWSYDSLSGPCAGRCWPRSPSTADGALQRAEVRADRPDDEEWPARTAGLSWAADDAAGAAALAGLTSIASSFRPGTNGQTKD